MIVLTAVTAVIYVAILIPFKSIPLVPRFTEIRPANMIPVTFGLFFGPAGAWGVAIGNILGDIFGRTFGAGSLFGFVGNFLFAYIPYKLWMNLGVLKPEEQAPDCRSTKKIMLFIVVAILASAACALFIAWGIDLLGSMSFAVLGTILLINNAIFACVLGFILTILLFPSIKKWNLYWMDVMPPSDLPKGGPIAKVGAIIVVVSIVVCLPVALVYALKNGNTQELVVMITAGIGSVGCLAGGVMMN